MIINNIRTEHVGFVVFFSDAVITVLHFVPLGLVGVTGAYPSRSAVPWTVGRRADQCQIRSLNETV